MGSFIQLRCGKGGALQTNIAGVCGECWVCQHWVCHTGLPQLTVVCAYWVCTAQAPGFSAGVLSKAGPAFHALPRSKLLRFRFRYSPEAQSRWGLRFVPFSGLSSSGNQVLGERALPRWVVCLITSLGPQVHSRSAVSGVPCVSSGELISGCDPPGRCQPSRTPGRLG